MNAPTSLVFDIDEIPFSRRGSWLNLSPVTGLHTRTDRIHLVSHRTGMHPILRLIPARNGEAVREDAITATPHSLTWQMGEGAIEAVFASGDLVRFRGRGLDLRLEDAVTELTPFTGSYLFLDPIDGSTVLTSYETGRRYRITPLSGTTTTVGSEALGAATRAVVASGDEWEIAVQEYETSGSRITSWPSFDAAVTEVVDEFHDYLDAVAGWRDDRTPAAAWAAYVLWSATVSAEGFLTRESILMSKHWMDKVWSWDHCFNALALAPGLSTEAWDQFLVVFDQQEPGGALPDSITHSEVLYNFVKPPIHGWTFRRLRELTPDLEVELLEEVYDRLSAWTRFWLEQRRVKGHALPHYQHGNDSGWDNSTLFDHDRVIETADLGGFLLIQLHVLADLADELGLAEDSEHWLSEHKRVQAAVIELWDGQTYAARGAHTGQSSKTTSLLTTLAITAANDLPAEHTAGLAARIRDHLTEWGPATQLVDTPEYEPDGYWRGPIWAPSTILIENGLRSAGHTELADTVSASFRRLCEQHGFAENFDALTGQGLRDRAYTWTASAYLLLAREATNRKA